MCGSCSIVTWSPGTVCTSSRPATTFAQPIVGSGDEQVRRFSRSGGVEREFELPAFARLELANLQFQLLYPNGKRETLLSVPRYDFNWQTGHQLVEPKRVPAGTWMGFPSSFCWTALERLIGAIRV